MKKERKGVICNSPGCEFYGTDYAHCCDQPYDCCKDCPEKCHIRCGWIEE